MVFLQKTLNSERMFDTLSFRWICQLGVLPGVGLLATRENAMLMTYVSPAQDPHATAVDASATDWNRGEKIYLFPPWVQVSRVLFQLQTFRGQAVLVAPRWPVRPWFPLLLSGQFMLSFFPNPRLFQEMEVRIYFPLQI